MPREVIRILYERWDFFQQLLLEHCCICGIAILLAGFFGIALGVLISEYGKFARPVLGITHMIYTIPSISLLGFLIPITGIGNGTAVIALTAYGLLPMIGNTHTGLAGIDPDVIEAAKGMGSSRRELLFSIKLPLAVPVILTALRTMSVMTIALAGIASFIGAGGLGVAIYRGITTNNMPLTVAGSLLIALTALAVDSLFHLLEKRIPWKKGQPHEVS